MSAWLSLAPEDYPGVRHILCGGKLHADGYKDGSLWWECKGCGARWAHRRLRDYSYDAIYSRFERIRTPSSGSYALVWREVEGKTVSAATAVIGPKDRPFNPT